MFSATPLMEVQCLWLTSMVVTWVIDMLAEQRPPGSIGR